MYSLLCKNRFTFRFQSRSSRVLSQSSPLEMWMAEIKMIVSSSLHYAYTVNSYVLGKGLGDNYAYLVVDDKSKEAVIVDPAHPVESVQKQFLASCKGSLMNGHSVLPVLRKKINDEHINLKAIINTHCHRDHAGGNNIMKKQPEFGDVPIIGGKDCESVQIIPKNENSLKVGNIKITALYTPCHTQDSICWLMEDGTQKVVFTGDTLFHGGCGRFFQGTAAEMNVALNKTLASLPDNTIVYPGHEYTKSNAKFAISVLKDKFTENLLTFAQENEETQGKFTIADEKDPKVQKATGKTNPIEVMSELREMKNRFS